MPTPRRGQQVRIEGNQWFRFPPVGNEQPSGNVRVVWPNDRVPEGVLLAPAGRVVTSDLIEGLRLYRVGSEEVTRDELVERIEARDRSARALKQQEREAKTQAERDDAARTLAAAATAKRELAAREARGEAKREKEERAQREREQGRQLLSLAKQEEDRRRAAVEREVEQVAAERRRDDREDELFRRQLNAVALQDEKLRALGLTRGPAPARTVSVGR